MSRRRETERGAAQPDPVFNSALVSTFINHMMWDGKKSVSANIFYTAMEKVAERSEEEPLKVFKKAVENCKPVVEVKSRRVGGANSQVPIEVPQARRMSLALRWLIGYARSRSV
jgi:small subunit ribosomal protein S7